MSDIYAEVDKSKKKRVKATEPNTHKPANSSMYATEELNTSSRRASDDVDNSSTYDLIEPKNLYSTVHSVNAAEVPQKRAISQEPSIASTDNSRLHHHERDKDRSPERNRNESKLPLCMLTCLVILAIAVIAAFVGVISAFVLISTLKSDMESRGSEPGSLESRLNKLDNEITNFIKTSQMMLMELSESTSNRVNSLEGDITAASDLATDLSRLLNSTVEKNSALQDQLTIKIDDLSANVINEAKKADQVIRTTEGMVNSSAIELATDIRAIYVFESCDIVSGLRFPFPSGTYRIGPSQEIYSLMSCSTSTTLTCNGISGQWRRVAYLNTTSQKNIKCPGCLKATTNPPSCRIFGSSPTCSSAFFSSGGLPYTQVCGRIYGRYSDSPDAFDPLAAGRPASPTIDDNYVDGVSLSYGMNPRNHVWTLAATVPQYDRKMGCTSCTFSVPNFVASDYTCQVVTDCTPLSDDSTCRPIEVWNDNNLCNGTNIFYRNLTQTTTEDLEMRLCRDQTSSDEDIFITFIEIFVSAP